MSGLEDRCAQFHEAATGTGKSKGAAKEMATLRRFLYKNQSQRFSDKAAARLFDTISIYANDKKEEGAEELLEDALKMPFTVFSTRQKSKMMKWMEALRGETAASLTGTEDAPPIVLTVTDVMDDKTVSLMNTETGDSWENIAVENSAVFTAIQSAFQSTDDAVDIKAEIHNGSISKILGIAKEEEDDADAKSSTCSCCG